VADPSEEQLAGGLITGAAKVGSAVHRATGPWTPTVHALLEHLERVGFVGAPRVLGFDDEGREILTFIEGTSGSMTFPGALHSSDGLADLAAFIRSFHDAVSGFEPGEDAVYRVGKRALCPGEIICHGDLGYWNTVWRGENIVGVIDWDTAEPAPAVRDLAVAAMTTVPFRDDDGAQRQGLSTPVDRRDRLAAMCRGYGAFTPAEVVEAALESLALETERLEVFGSRSIEPWASLRERGQHRMFDAVRTWIDQNRSILI
jgi:hypothetical protein